MAYLLANSIAAPGRGRVGSSRLRDVGPYRVALGACARRPRGTATTVSALARANATPASAFQRGSASLQHRFESRRDVRRSLRPIGGHSVHAKNAVGGARSVERAGASEPVEPRIVMLLMDQQIQQRRRQHGHIASKRSRHTVPATRWAILDTRMRSAAPKSFSTTASATSAPQQNRERRRSRKRVFDRCACLNEQQIVSASSTPPDRAHYAARFCLD